jgi:hypothetical protein
MQTIYEGAHAGKQEGGADQLVQVDLNGMPREIRRGEYTGRTLKLVLGAPAEHELDKVVNGEFIPIANDEKIHIHGGEKFVSHCGQGQSS